MRTYVVSCVFPPEPVVSSQTSSDVAAGLASRGHDVTVFTAFPSRPGRALYPAQKRWRYAREAHATHAVVRCPSTYSAKSTLVSRFAENLSFGITAALAVVFAPRADVIYSNTWPLFATGLLRVAAWLRRTPVVLTVQDIYPESLLAQRRVGERNTIVRMLKSLDGRVARSCAAVIVISQRFANLYLETRGVPRDRVVVVPNWIDPSTLTGDADTAALRRRHGIPDSAFLAVYAGNVGAAADVKTVVEAVGLIPADESIHLLVAGDGSHLQECRATAQAIGALNVHFHHPFPTADTASVLAAAQLLVLPTFGTQSESSVPSKLISYMLSARPVLAMASPVSDLAAIMATAGCGAVIEPGSAQRTAEAIRQIASLDSRERGETGIAGRRYAEQHLTRDVCLPKVLDVVEGAAGRLQDAASAQIRPMLREDVAAVVRVHLDAFPGFFLSFLGPAFLRLLYRGILADQSGIALVAASGGRVYGFVAGTAQPANFYRNLLKKAWWRFGLASVPALLRRPSSIMRLARALTMPRQADRGAGGGWLMSIAVSPQAQCGGVGGNLVRSFLTAAARRGVDRVYLTTDAAGNAAVNSFYERLGFRVTRQFATAEGRAMNEFTYVLEPPPAAEAPPVEAIAPDRPAFNAPALHQE